jgi:hypothetical protein
MGNGMVVKKRGVLKQVNKIRILYSITYNKDDWFVEKNKSGQG